MRTTEHAAVVVGGSLSGLMAALGLARYGIGVTVLERSGPQPRTGAALGGAEGNLHRLFGADGLAGPEATAAALDGPRPHLQSWAQAHGLLRRAAEADPHIELVHGARVVEVGQDATSAWARTADGVLHHGDLVVGADGHRSVARRHVAPEHPDAAFAGYVIWLGIAEESEMDFRGPWPGMDIFDAGSDCLLGYPLAESAPPGQRRLGWAWFDPRRNDLLRAKGCVDGEVVQHSLRPEDMPTDLVADLDAEAEQWPEAWREAVRACLRRRGVTGTPVAEYVPDRLARGRIALVGDAAHVSTPMTGRGFGVALTDAEVLADEVAKAFTEARGDAVPAALRTYERRSLGRAREAVESGRASPLVRRVIPWRPRSPVTRRRR
ncbi:2-polyprenyl-6-methoxyphenol hydroxylase [Amycolatopsis sacchari]|uniref:2-polyprenyl-6-methoxyphenol hydroxylase n=1 Tax=Amycolatopsis sacchari TaxID=115433 RepID=A0A1I3RE53_9PSEU|nr:FAD-dependent monooxygenase [Amycolatopsis sacchari]SFJ44122.1 2-polyprenyl-6-methoxyphenol hydroxylase [Amycolatopsis sacchari]